MNFPEGMYLPTNLLVEEVSQIFQSMAVEYIKCYITLSDYQYYWKKVKERILSSYGGLHIGHKAIAYNKSLAALHYAKLNEMTIRGLSLKRWGKGVTLLLERVTG